MASAVDSQLLLSPLGALLKAAPVAIMAVDLTGRVILWSDAAQRVFGWSADEVHGLPMPIVPEDKQDEFRGRILGSSAGVNNHLTVRVARDGRRVPVRLSSAPICGDGGERLGTIAMLVDATEEMSLRSALVESEHRFAAVFEESPIGKMMVRGSDRTIVEANKAFLKLFQMERSDVIGKPTSVLPLDRATSDRDHFWGELRKSGRLTDYLVTFTSKDGARREAVVSAELLFIGEEEYGLAAIQDVTERRQMERDLRESDERFRQISQTIEEVFWLSDLDKQQIVYVSPAYDRIWGRDGRALFDDPRAWLDAIHEDDRERVLDAALTKQVLGTYDEVYRIVRPDGKIRWIRDRGYPVRDATGRVVRVAGSAQDITAEHDLEGQLRHTQKMESIGLLAGGVAHDFNNLLTVIGGNCDLLSETVEQSQEAAVLVGEIRDAAARAGQLTRQLLSFSRREVISPKVVSLDASIMQTKKMLDRLLGEDVILTLALAPGKPRIKVDPGSFGQVLMNLAVNARDAMPCGGDLTIRTEVVALTEQQRQAHPTLSHGQFVKLTVADTGRGIPEGLVGRVFEPFFTTKGLGNGTGLGLSVVHGIVAQSGGLIEVESTVNVGTAFHAYWPVVDDSETASEGTPSDQVPVGTGTILFVEDESGIRRVGMRALERQGYMVLEAADAEHALAVAEAYGGPIDLLVADVVMPRMGGRELADALRDKQPQMRVLYTSGYTDDAVLRHGVRAAEVSFLPKPYDLASLRQKVRVLLNRSNGTV